MSWSWRRATKLIDVSRALCPACLTRADASCRVRVNTPTQSRRQSLLRSSDRGSHKRWTRSLFRTASLPWEPADLRKFEGKKPFLVNRTFETVGGGQRRGRRGFVRFCQAPYKYWINENKVSECFYVAKPSIIKVFYVSCS